MHGVTAVRQPSIPPEAEFLERNSIKGGEWPEFLIANSSAFPVYGVKSVQQHYRAVQHRSQDCDAHLEHQNISFSISNMVTYIAPAKAGSRTVRDSLCGCNSDPKLGYSRLSIPGCANQKRCAQQHHGHRCSIRHIEERGARKIIVPVREPWERLRSLSIFQSNWYKLNEHGGLVGVDFVKAYDDLQSHESAVGNLTFAWQSYAYYFLNATGEYDLEIICVGENMVTQYNYGIQKMAGKGETKMMFIPMLRALMKQINTTVSTRLIVIVNCPTKGLIIPKSSWNRSFGTCTVNSSKFT